MTEPSIIWMVRVLVEHDRDVPAFMVRELLDLIEAKQTGKAK